MISNIAPPVYDGKGNDVETIGSYTPARLGR